LEIKVKYKPNDKQCIFHSSDADEVVYGGAKGGGKSCALVMECLAYGLEYPGANMYIFRETYDDLEANIIKEWKEKVPRELYKYNESKHQATLTNGTSVKFRYIRNYADAEGYQGRSMDWIGVDELTKHERRTIQILLSCLRSPKGFPPRFRGTCNPGGIGHEDVKEDYIEPTDYGKKIVLCPVTGNKRQFIPATVFDNFVLMENDPNYVKRLQNLPEREKQAFLYGNWDIFEGRHFREFDRNVHVIPAFAVPDHWDRYVSMDYGLDMFAVGWYSIDTRGKHFLYRVLDIPDLIISKAAEALKEATGNERIRYYYAPPDLWNRRQETGNSVADIFYNNGISLTKTSNDRSAGALAIKEILNVYDSVDPETGEATKDSLLKIFDTCKSVIKSIRTVLTDEKCSDKYANMPHEITHALDQLRGYAVGRQKPTKVKKVTRPKVNTHKRMRTWNGYN